MSHLEENNIGWKHWWRADKNKFEFLFTWFTKCFDRLPSKELNNE